MSLICQQLHLGAAGMGRSRSTPPAYFRGYIIRQQVPGMQQQIVPQLPAPNQPVQMIQPSQQPVAPVPPVQIIQASHQHVPAAAHLQIMHPSQQPLQPHAPVQMIQPLAAGQQIVNANVQQIPVLMQSNTVPLGMSAQPSQSVLGLAQGMALQGQLVQQQMPQPRPLNTTPGPNVVPMPSIQNQQGQTGGQQLAAHYLAVSQGTAVQQGATRTIQQQLVTVTGVATCCFTFGPSGFGHWPFLVKIVTIDVSDSLVLGEKRSELLSRETNPGPLN